MKSILNHLKPFDYIFIVLAIVISFIPNLITYANHQASEEVNNYSVLVKINGQVVDEFPLNEGVEMVKTYYPNQGQYNIIEVQDDRARIKEDNSPDQIGVNMGWISQPGQTAICLPHGLIIEVKGQTVEDDDLILPLP